MAPEAALTKGRARMAEDPDKAREAVMKDGLRMARNLREAGLPAEVMSLDNRDQWPDCGDGEGVWIPFTIGRRDQLTKDEVKSVAEMWRAATARYPKAIFQILFLGYDDDPRELWEFSEARRYVRWFARLTGLNDPAEADRWVGSGEGRLEASLDPERMPYLTTGSGLLAICGVFGEQARQLALSNVKPTSKQ
jgi:hypothetical protein